MSQMQEYILKTKKEEILVKIVRSNRRSAGLEVKGEQVTARVPFRFPQEDVIQMIDSHAKWITDKLELARERKKNGTTIHISPEDLTEENIAQMKEKFRQKVENYAKLMGVTYGRITIRNQKTRWGSCSSDGNLNFNFKLFFLPEHLMDYVVVHELAHRIHMNHSKDFWNMVGRIMPDYKIYKQWLREHGHELTLENHLKRKGIPLSLD